jgi:ATP-dependent helicase/DNAse subunit B
MRLLYEPFSVIKKEQFAEIEKNMQPVIDRCIAEHFSPADTLDGKNILMRKVLNELVQQIFAYDKLHAPLKIKFLEKEIGMPFKLKNGNTILMYGKIDRVDADGESLRGVDYKTGRGDTNTAKNISELFERPDRKEQFQNFYYSWLLHKQDNSSLKAGLFRMREFSQGIKYINEGEVLTAERFDEFENHLNNLVEDIFNPEIPFSPTEDEERCIFCNFKDICNR